MDMNLIINIAIAVLLVWFIYSRFAGVKGLKNLSSEQFQNELKGNGDKMIIDVREPNEVKQGFIPGAINIPLSSLQSRAHEISKDKPIYLYCQSGMRSKQAARILLKQGFSNMAQLRGGIMAWRGQVLK
jgi:rhodanese-related sulfurtransferase